jgi:hypothetical protein
VPVAPARFELLLDGDINVPMLDFTLPFPVSDRLRPLAG